MSAKGRFDCINGICSDLSSYTYFKNFADDTFLTAVVNNESKTFENLNNDLCIPSEWTN